MALSASPVAATAPCKRVGWHFVQVTGDGSGPDFAFTLGLFAKANHPEIIVVGLPAQTSDRLLKILMVKIFGAKERMQPLERHVDIANGFPLTFVPVTLQHYRDYLGYANWYYGALTKPYPALQMVWPDKAGRFPWEAGYDRSFDAAQPILGDMPQ